MQLSDKLNRLLAHAWELLDVPEEEIMEIALEQLIQNINASITPIEGGMDMKTILARAYERNQVSKGFTLDELMDDLYGDSPIFSPQSKDPDRETFACLRFSEEAGAPVKV